MSETFRLAPSETQQFHRSLEAAFQPLTTRTMRNAYVSYGIHATTQNLDNLCLVIINDGQSDDLLYEHLVSRCLSKKVPLICTSGLNQATCFGLKKFALSNPSFHEILRQGQDSFMKKQKL